MARPKHSNPALFTGGEVAAATGLSPRNVQYLRDLRLGPFASGIFSDGLYDEDVLAELAMVAGMIGPVVGLTVGVALVGAFLSENPNHGAARFCLLDQRGLGRMPHENGWFRTYASLRSGSDADLTGAFDDDQSIFIADWSQVMSGAWHKPRLPMLVSAGVDPQGPFALGRVEGLGRGNETVFHSFVAEHGSEETLENVAAQIEAQRALRNATSLLSVNLSRAVRVAFARVYSLRLAKGGPLWAEGA